MLAKNLPAKQVLHGTLASNRKTALACINKYQRTIENCWRKLNVAAFGSKNWKARHELLARYTDERNGAVRLAYEMDLISEEEYEIYRLNRVGR